MNVPYVHPDFRPLTARTYIPPKTCARLLHGSEFLLDKLTLSMKGPGGKLHPTYVLGFTKIFDIVALQVWRKKCFTFLYVVHMTGNAYMRKIHVTTKPSKQANIFRNLWKVERCLRKLKLRPFSFLQTFWCAGGQRHDRKKITVGNIDCWMSSFKVIMY